MPRWVKVDPMVLEVRFVPLHPDGKQCHDAGALGRGPRLFAKSALRSLSKCAELACNSANTLWLRWGKQRTHQAGSAGMFGHLPIVFDSTTVAEWDRFAFAREEYGRKALKVDLETLGDAPFRLRMRAGVYGSVRVAVIESTPYRVQRTRPLIADGDDRIGLLFPLAGRFGGEQGGQTVAANRGEATTMVADRLGWFGTATGGTFLTIRADPELVKRNSQDLNRIKSGVTVQPTRLGFDLIRSYLSTLNRRGAEASPHFREMAGRHLAELGTYAFSGAEASPRSSQDGEGLRTARFAAALDHMAQQFMDPGYDVGACAGHLGISVRYLQVLLEAGGTGFSKELTRLRLERAYNLLCDPSNAVLRVSDIVYDCGFSDISHFNRQFRAHFGENPTSVRGTSSAAPGLQPIS